MSARRTITAALAMLACPAAVCAAPAIPAAQPAGLVRTDLDLAKRRAPGDDSRWLLPDLSDSYERREAKPRLRIRGRKIKWWMPLG